MSTKLRFGLLVCVLFITAIIHAQQRTYQLGLLPAVNISTQLPRDFKLNGKIESRQLLRRGVFKTEEQSTNYDYVLTDFSLLAAKKIGPRTSLAAGYLLRVEDDRFLHRSIQHLIVTQSYTGIRLSHRFSADQTFDPEESTEFRARYRLAAELPLNGRSADADEFYLKASNEYLNAWQGQEYDLEIRLVSLLGYRFTDSKKIELGLDYRLDSFLNQGSRQRLWIGLNWYQVI